MKTFLIFAVVISAVALHSVEAASIGANNTVCGWNEEYRTCGTACEATCVEPGPTVCTLQCVQGCFCTDGNLRSSQGICISKRLCFWDLLFNGSG